MEFPQPIRKTAVQPRWRFCLCATQDSCWLLLAILVPLSVNLWGQRPFELPKVALMRTLVWLLLALTLTDHILTCRKFNRNPLAGTVGLLAVVIVVTTITAVNPQLSLWGSHERQQGAVTLLTYLLLFLLAADQLHHPARARRLMMAMVATALPLTLFSLAQVVGWNPFALISTARSPIYATLGRANFVGAYLAMLTPLTLALWLTTRHKMRAIWASLLMAELLTIGLTLTRSAWLSTAVSLSIFALLWAGGRWGKRWQMAAWGGVTALFFSGVLSVFWLGARQVGSIAARLAIWRGMVELIGKRPFLGYGADTLGIIFPRIYPPELVYYQGRGAFVDRAHNLLLDWLAAAGISGAMAFAFVLLLFALTIARALRREMPPSKRALLAAAAAAVAGNVANTLVSFDVTATAMAMWLLMGLAVALATTETGQQGVVGGKRPFFHWAVVVLLFVTAGMASWGINGRLLTADIAARTAQRQAQAGDWAEATAAAEQAITHWPSEPAYHLLLHQTYWQRAMADPAAAPRWLAQAEAALLTAQQMRPNDFAIWMHAAGFYSATSRADRADWAYQQAATLAPNHAIVYAAWGRAKMEEGEWKTAVSLYQQAVRLDSSNRDVYAQLSKAAAMLGGRSILQN